MSLESVELDAHRNLERLGGMVTRSVVVFEAAACPEAATRQFLRLSCLASASATVCLGLTSAFLHCRWRRLVIFASALALSQNSCLDFYIFASPQRFLWT